MEYLRDLISESLLLQLAIIIFSTKIAGALSKKINQPSVFGELLIGIIIGPSLLGLLYPEEILKGLAEVGVIILMFLAGLETDVEEFKKAGYASTLTAIGGVILPMAAGTLFAVEAGFNLLQAFFVGTVLTATSVSISAQTLRELGKLRTSVGMTILGAAVIDDVLGIVVLTLVLGLAGGGGGGAVGVVLLIFKMILFFVFSIFIGKKVVPAILRFAEKIPVVEGLSAAALILAFIFAFISEKSGVANITGAYIAGILISLTDYKDHITEKIDTVGFSLLIPVFFVSIGLLAEVRGLAENLFFVIIVSLIAIFTKIIGCGVGAKIARFNFKDSLTIGTGMISRGEIALIVASIGFTRHLINQSMYTAMVVMVLATTLVTPPLLKGALIWGDTK